MKWVYIVHILLKFISNVSVYVCCVFDGGLFFTCVLSKIFCAWCMTLHPLSFGSIHNPVKLQGSWNMFSCLQFYQELWNMMWVCNTNWAICSQDRVHNAVRSYCHFMLFFIEDGLVILCLDLFTAGAESVSNTLSFCLLYMVLHPRVQEAVQKELDMVIGHSRRPTLEDRAR